MATAPAWEAPVAAWICEQGWTPEDYCVAPSAVQSCPAGMVTLDCDCVAESATAQARSHASRVLEVDAISGAVAAVLAARDGEQLERILRAAGADPAAVGHAAPIDPGLALPPATAAPLPAGDVGNLGSAPTDALQWEAYTDGKEELADAIRREGRGYFRPSAAGGSSRVGLLNQGATCYMNSLLQTLYLSQEFRDYIFRWRYTPDRDGPPDCCIALQLQALFARLACSRCAAVSTKPLTHSFGWTGAEAFQQHDVQELNRVLFDALGRSNPAFASVAAHFTGRVNDFIQVRLRSTFGSFCLVLTHFGQPDTGRALAGRRLRAEVPRRGVHGKPACLALPQPYCVHRYLSGLSVGQ